MAFDPTFKMAFQDASGNYYKAIKSTLGVWTVTTSSTPEYLKVLPEGWDKTAIRWERDRSYLGVFRSKSDESFLWVQDARAIITSIWNAHGIRGFCTFSIYMLDFPATGIVYNLFYQSCLDFKTYSDNQATEKLSIGSLDSGLFRDFKAYADTAFNVPIWHYDTGLGTWLPEGPCVLHDGIKVLYSSTFVGGASLENTPKSVLDFRGQMGFNQGKHNTPGTPDDGYHITPILSQYAPVQENGATTFFGNDILNAFLPLSNQTPGVTLLAGPVGGFPNINEEDFSGVNNARPYSANNFSIKNALTSASAFTVQCSVSGTFAWPNPADTGLYLLPFYGKVATTGAYLRFVLFEIDADDNPVTVVVSGNSCYTYQTILQLNLPDADTTVGSITIPNGGNFSNYPGGKIPLMDGTGTVSANPAIVTINPNKVYVFGLVFDNGTSQGGDPSTGLNHSYWWTYGLSNMQFTLFSNSDSGASGIPIPAPSFPPSAFYGFRPYQLLEKLVPYLATRQTDGYGFPVPVATPYNGHSDYLQDSTLSAVQDVVPFQVIMSSAYCLHNLEGQSYLTLSLNNLFDFCKKILGCGLSIEGDTIRVEDLKYFLDASTMILDLGDNVADLEIEQMNEGIGASLKLGYTQQNTNADFGVETVHTELFFNTPVAEIPGIMDYQETSIIVDPYVIEKSRSQRVNQPIGTAYNPGNPSGTDNQTMAFYTLPHATHVIPDPDYPITMYDPSNLPIPGQRVFQLTQRNGVNLPAAQSTDPTAASAPYIYGLRYPDSMYNIELSPCRSLQRPTGALLHSVLHQMDSESLTFRNTYIMQFNNKVLALSGIESNLEVGASAPVITEFKDIRIGALPDKLFLPVKLKIKTKTPVNMYSIINGNPRGYIKFKWYLPAGGSKIYKGFIARVEQNAGNRSPTEMELWATPDMTF